MPAQIAADGTFVGRASHEIIGARYLKQLGFNDKVCQLVEAHVMAKRYLATDQSYYNSLSKSSKATLEYQVSNSITET
jgi:2-amino-1-hydroxyethylphosphonate dioxygenase (glycine-forming)